MNISPINFQGNQVAPKKPLTKGQKAAIATAAIAGTAAAASVVVAAVKGKTPDTKGLQAIKAGYAKMGNGIKKVATQVVDTVKNAFAKKAEAATEVVAEAAEAIAE